MPKTTDVPVELREFNKIFERLSRRWDYSGVFSDFLTITMNFFSDNTMIKERDECMAKYSQDEKQIFNELFSCWFQKMQDVFLKEDRKWYDFFGDFYQVLAGMGKQQALGQFFTPTHVCDFMAQIVMNEQQKTEKGGWSYRGDPACGSARTILAMHTNSDSKRAYYIAEDLDRICCMMASINMMIHGCIGEVVWHNSLDPNSFHGGWLINSTLPRFNIPSIIKVESYSQLWSCPKATNVVKSPDSAPVTKQKEAAPASVVNQETAQRINGQLTIF